jgi:hypothetical protein
MAHVPVCVINDIEAYALCVEKPKQKAPHRVFDKGLRFCEPKFISYVMDSYLLENRIAGPRAGNNISTLRESEMSEGIWMWS